MPDPRAGAHKPPTTRNEANYVRRRAGPTGEHGYFPDGFGKS
jgi:hypothetical protein